MKSWIIDHHVHSQYSPDASKEATFLAYIQQAKAQGVKRLIFTDHVDIESVDSLFSEIIDYDVYHKALKEIALQEDFHVSLGVEMGYMPHVKDRMEAFVKQYPFEYVICSIHFCDGLDLYNGDFFKEKTQKEAYQRYFEICLDAVTNYDAYDVFGHLDYIIRYGNYENKRYVFEEYQEIIESILRVIIQKNKGIEINTSGLRYGLETTHPTLDLLKAYKRLGGKIVTFGSDAHHPKHYRYGLDQAITLLKAAGFDEIAIFENRKPTFIRL